MQQEPKAIHHVSNAESFFVKPSCFLSSSPNNFPITYHLSTLDVSQPSLVVGSIYIFKEDLPIENLLSSVADALTHIPSLGGSLHLDFGSVDNSTKRIVTGGKVIVNESSGIWVRSVTSSFTSSSSPDVILKAQQDHFLEIGEKRQEGCPLPQDPLGWVQLTHLSDGGCALGVGVHHFLSDAEGNIGFARLISHYLNPHLSPSQKNFPQDSRFCQPTPLPPPSPLLPSLWCKWNQCSKEEQLLQRSQQEWGRGESEPFFFDFSVQKLNELKSLFLSSLQSVSFEDIYPEGGYLTSNDIVVAIVWYSIAAARASCSSPLRSQNCYQVVNYKQKREHPIPAPTFGNHILLSSHSASSPLPLFSSITEEILQAAAYSAANVHNEVRQQMTEATIQNSLAVLHEIGASPLRSNIPQGDIVFSSWVKFNMESVTIRDSPPLDVLHRPVANWPGFVFLLPLIEKERGGGRGVRVFLRLNKKEMSHFRSIISCW